MNQKRIEQLLCSMYLATAISSLITSITSGVVWGYWRWTLDQCIGYNCSCILYGVSTPTHFHGGNMWTCMWISFGPIPVILIFLSLATYHGFRACGGPKSEVTKSVMAKNESGEMIHLQVRTCEMDPINRCYWMTTTVLSYLFALYMFAHFVVFADGYLYSCRQYKRQVIELLHLSGIAVGVVHNRLTCNAIFDFMDYLQPMYNYYIRDNFINTAAALLIGIITSFSSTFCLGVASFLNTKMVRNKD